MNIENIFSLNEYNIIRSIDDKIIYCYRLLNGIPIKKITLGYNTDNLIQSVIEYDIKNHKYTFYTFDFSEGKFQIFKNGCLILNGEYLNNKITKLNNYSFVYSNNLIKEINDNEHFITINFYHSNVEIKYNDLDVVYTYENNKLRQCYFNESLKTLEYENDKLIYYTNEENDKLLFVSYEYEDYDISRISTNF